MSMLHTYLDYMKQFLAFRSISTDPQYKDELAATADFLVKLLADHGFTAQAITGYSNPIVVAHYVVDPSLPTYLVYGHYDVQPADLAEGWEQDPFDLHLQGIDEEGTIASDAKLIARGAVDNKGQIMLHIVTILDLIKQGTLRYNVKFMIEGDEETGSPYLETFLHDHKDLLACDAVMVSDGEIIGDHTPTIGAGFRGGCNMTIALRTADADLHSGLYGGIAPNAAYEASKLLARLYNDKHWLTIDGYYDTIREITDEMLTNNTQLPITADDIKTTTGIKDLLVHEGYDIATANGLLPTIQVSGIQSGYTGEGYRNAIPATCLIKLNFRFAPGQEPQETIGLFTDWVAKHLPAYVDYTIETSDPYSAITIMTDHHAVQTADSLLSDIYGKPAVYRYCGAAIPVTGLFQDVLGAVVIIADLANEDCGMHGVGENFRIGNVEKGLEFSRRFFRKEE